MTEGGKKKKPPAFQHLAELLRAAYGAKRKRLKVGKAEMEALRLASTMDSQERAALLELAATDRTLERTRDLLLLCMERMGNHPVAGAVRAFAAGVLRGHPAYRAETLNGVLENLPETSGEEESLRALMAQDFAALRWTDGVPQLTKSEAGKCRANALCCLLLWFHETRGTSSDAIQRHLFEFLWSGPAARQRGDARLLKALMLSRDRVAIGLVWSGLERRVADFARAAAGAREVAARAEARAEALAGELADMRQRTEAAEDRVSHLESEIEGLRKKHADELAHLRNDMEALKGRLRSRLRREVELLQEGLQALKRQPPKVHVMEDHAERAIDGLKSEIDQLKEGG